MTRELLAPWVALVFEGQRAIAVWGDPRVTLACKARRETRVMSAFADLQVPLAFLVLQVLKVPLASVAQSDQSDAVVSRARGALLASLALVVLRVMSVTVAFAVLRASVVRLATQALVALVVTRVSKALVVFLASQECVVFLVLLERWDLLAPSVCVVLVVCPVLVV